MSRQWMLSNGVLINERGARTWNAAGVSVSERITDEQAAELISTLLTSMAIRYSYGF